MYLDSSESHVINLLQQIRDNQDTINSLNDAAEFEDLDRAISIASDHTTFCRIDRTLVIARDTSLSRDPNMIFSRDHKAGGDTTATSVQSYTVLLVLKGNENQISKVPIATHTFPHFEANPAASIAAASNSLQS